jgi:hypothetical protein
MLVQMLVFHVGGVGGFGITLVFVVSLSLSSATSGVFVYGSIARVSCLGGLFSKTFNVFVRLGLVHEIWFSVG